MLRALCDNGVNGCMSTEEAQTFDQRPFRSMLIQGWCAYRTRRGFHVTKKGEAAMREFLSTDIARKNPKLPLTSYFDPTLYKLTAPKKVHVMQKRGAA
jgi:hypothetical protein